MSDELVELRDQVGVLRRRWYLVVVTLLVCLGLSLLYISRTTPTYVATAEVLLGAPSGQGSRGLTDNQIATEARVVTASDAVSYVIRSLQLDETPSDLVRSVAVEPDPAGGAVLKITATRHDPDRAAGIANALAGEYVRGRAASVGEDAEIISLATAPRHPASPRLIPTMLLAGTLGLLLGFGLAFLRQYFDDSVHDEGDAAAVTRRPVLGRIPHGRRAIRRSPVTLTAPDSRASEAYRALAATLRYRLSRITPHKGQRNRGRVVLVTSASAREGKTQTAVNAAVAAASAGLDVVLVNADLRSDDLGSLFDLPPGPGIGEILTDGSELRVRLKEALVETDVERLRVLPSGAATSRSGELLAAPRWESLLTELRATFDLVVIDSAAVLPVVDTLEIVRGSDLTLLVVRRDVSRKRQLAAAIDRIEQVGGVVDGVVFCDVPRRSSARMVGTSAARGLPARPPGDVEEDPRARLNGGGGGHGAEELASPRQSP